MKFYVDYTRMYGTIARIDKNSGVDTIENSRACVIDRMKKLDNYQEGADIA